MTIGLSSLLKIRTSRTKDNQVAHATYAALGMKETDYLLYEELKPGIRFLK